MFAFEHKVSGRDVAVLEVPAGGQPLRVRDLQLAEADRVRLAESPRIYGLASHPDPRSQEDHHYAGLRASD